MNDRIFTTSDFVRDGIERTVVRAYGDDDLMALVEWAEPGQLLEPPHWHPQAAHVFVFTEGEGETLLGSGVWEKVTAGQFLVNPRNRVHAVRNTSATDRLVWVCVHVTHGLPYEVIEVDESAS